MSLDTRALTDPVDRYAVRPPPGVAHEGRRLRTSVPLWVWIGGGAMVLFWLLTQTGALGFIFSGVR